MQSTRSTTSLEKIEVKEVEKMMETFKQVLRIDKPLELALAMLDGI
jgi:hypothetical protein